MSFYTVTTMLFKYTPKELSMANQKLDTVVIIWRKIIYAPYMGIRWFVSTVNNGQLKVQNEFIFQYATSMKRENRKKNNNRLSSRLFWSCPYDTSHVSKVIFCFNRRKNNMYDHNNMYETVFKSFLCISRYIICMTIQFCIKDTWNTVISS